MAKHAFRKGTLRNRCPPLALYAEEVQAIERHIGNVDAVGLNPTFGSEIGT